MIMEHIQTSPETTQPPVRWATPPRGELDRFKNVRPTDSYIDVGTLLTQFRGASPVRSIAEGVLGNTHQPHTSNLPLFSALANDSPNHWREQVVAAWALARVPLETQERDAAAGMLLESLERDCEDTLWERSLRGLLWGYGFMLPICLICSLMICAPGSGVEWADVFPKMLFITGAWASVLTVPICLAYGRVNAAHNNLLRAAAAESLGRLNVIESIGPLAEKLFDASVPVREASAHALIELLPRLRDSDIGALEPEAIARLAEALTHPNTLVVLKVLEALNKVGSGSTLAAVDRLAREGKTSQLRESARQVAAVLEERRRREREARHLMRPTSSSEYRFDGSAYENDLEHPDETHQMVNGGDGTQPEWL